MCRLSPRPFPRRAGGGGGAERRRSRAFTTMVAGLAPRGVSRPEGRRSLSGREPERTEGPAGSRVARRRIRPPADAGPAVRSGDVIWSLTRCARDASGRNCLTVFPSPRTIRGFFLWTPAGRWDWPCPVLSNQVYGRSRPLPGSGGFGVTQESRCRQFLSSFGRAANASA